MVFLRKVLLLLIAGLVLVTFLIVLNPGIIFHLSTWKTQEVCYRSRREKDHRIEFQMKDIGALGYKQRIVEVKPFLWFNIISETDTSALDKQDWDRVDEYVNELELKGP
ncbi:MAG: hypothetical protein ICV83_08115 [Cytophagales bacterium]|nr:hypothetical protein [Cytophagales bacterium]